MSTEKITIEVSEEIAQAYENASPERRQRAQRTMAYALMSRGKVAKKFRQMTTRTGKRAEELGLTEDKLPELLDED